MAFHSSAVATRTTRLVTSLALVLVATIGAAASYAGTKTWTGSSTTEWNTAGNWSGGLPTSGDDAVIPANVASGRYPVVSTANADAKTVTLQTGAGTQPTLTVSAQTLTVAGNFKIDAGTVTLSGGTIAETGGAGSITGTLDVSGGTWLGSVTLTINNGGNVNVSSGTLHMASALATNPTDVITIAAGGTLTQSGGSVDNKDLTTTAGSPDGTYNMSGGTYKHYHDFKNSGTFNATGGTVEFAAAGGGGTFPSSLGPTQFFNVLCDVDPVFDNQAISFSVAGNWTANAAINMSSKAITITFNGTGAQTIGGTSTTTWRNLTINKSSGTATLGVNQTLTNGDLTVTAGTLDLSSYTINRSSSGGTITVSNGATLKIGGTNSFPSNYATHSVGSSTSTVEYEGTNQTVTNETYGHLTLSGSGTKTMPGTTLAIGGNFTMTGTPSATAAAAINTTGNFSVGSGCTFTTGSFTHDIKGDFTNDGTFTATGSTITLTGTSDQAIAGASTTTFNNLTVNKSSTKVTLSTTTDVSGTLTFTSGNISTGSNTLVITSTGSVSRTSGHVVGNLQKAVATGSSIAKTFEIGSSSSYTPISLTFASVSVAGNLTCSTTNGDHPNISSSDVNPSKSVNRYWTLTSGGGLTFTNFDCTFNFVSGDVDAGAATANFIVRRWSGSAWSNTNISTRTSTSTKIVTQTTVGDFQVGNILSVSSSASTFAFGTQPVNTWLSAQSSTITNDGTETETIVAKISTLTQGSNTWTISSSTNGADKIRAQWSTTSATGPWTDISAYDTNFTINSSLAASGTLTLYLRIQTPTSTASYSQYSSTLTVTAQ